MPFPFRYICHLLQCLEDELRPSKKQKTSSKTLIENWFREHRLRLDAPTVDICAILSTLLPERRTDRVYGIQATRLESIVGQALGLGRSRVKELRRYKVPGLGLDLGDCVHDVLKITPNAIHKGDVVTVEEIDEALNCIAASCRFSSPAVRASRRIGNSKGENHILAQFYARLSAQDAKWFTRLVLKNYQPIILEERIVLQAYHILLPQVLKVQDDLTVAARLIKHVSPLGGEQVSIASILKPTLGTKVGRQQWFKGRSIKHCVDMARQRQFSCEQKIDGEYCQIHIDLRKNLDPIQIFSKSGKDSTMDRKGLHRAIRESLKLGAGDCPFRLGCILEGELVVYSTKEQKILPFHKIRKHVSRSGRFIGTRDDSQAHEHEHLMIIYYDVLSIDTESLLGMKHSERFQRLEDLVTCRKGHAELVPRQIISFSRRNAASQLREIFAKCIIAKGEGLVLKPDDPYFDFSTPTKSYASCNIKLKKEYIQGWGDVGDFAVIGASYDAAKARTYKIPNLNWTDFYIGCLLNRDRARARTEKPSFMVTNIVDLTETLLSTFRAHCNPVSISFNENDSVDLKFGGIGNTKKPTVVFPEPVVFDMRCFSFDKEANSRTWSMRFPTVSKIHFDRSYLDTITFAELQEAARTATEARDQEDSQEMRHWISALEKADPRGIAVDATSQQTVSTDRSTPVRGRLVESPRSNYLSTIEEAGLTNVGSPTKGENAARLPVLAPLTPPRSSANEKHKAATTSSQHAEGQKRACELHTDTSTAKKRKQLPVAGSGQFWFAASSFSGPAVSPAKQRNPLGAIDGNTSFAEQKSPSPDESANGLDPGGEGQGPPHLPEISFPSLVTRSSSIADESSPAPPTHPSTISPRRGDNEVQKQPHMASEHTPSQLTTCAHSGPRCTFKNCSFLLAPCISNYAWVTENLLRGHGIFDFTVDPNAWTKEAVSNVSSQASSPTANTPMTDINNPPRSTKPARVRRICLVETRRPEATHEFLRRIEKAGLKRRNGQREWLAVYDWRILEDFTNIEARAGQKGPDPWRHRYVGIA